MQNYKQFKKLEALTMKDDFMFGAVMCDPENCRPLLEMALGFPIGRVTVSTEKSLVYHPEYKGVRLDVEAQDEAHTRYNVEMQVVAKPHLGHRARYYHSQIDMELLKRGQGYGELPDAYVIFLCDFDPFGLGKYRYTFQNVCQEVPGFPLMDGQETLFLSTKGQNEGEVPEELIRFLRFLGSDLKASCGDFQDGYVERLQEAVKQVKASREMEARYMVFEELLQDKWEAGRAEGIEIGRTEGIGIGRAEGRTEGIEVGRAEGIEIGRTEGIGVGCAESVLELLRELPDELPEGLVERITSEKDVEVLKRYLRLAAKADSVEEFLRQMG